MKVNSKTYTIKTNDILSDDLQEYYDKKLNELYKGTTNLDIEALSFFCKDCPYLDIETTRFYSEDEVYYQTHKCKNLKICRYAAEMYVKREIRGDHNAK